jgi:hypothetical protein
LGAIVVILRTPLLAQNNPILKMTPHRQEAIFALLTYAGFAVFALVFILESVYTVWRVKKDKANDKRKEHILDQLNLRGQELSLLIQDLWQRNLNKKQ